MELQKWLCTICEKRFIVDDTHHHLDYCPCKASFVDLESYGCRASVTATYVETFNAPHFTDETEYHSALLSWLNDSDEEYTLKKPENVLYIIKVKPKKRKV